MSPPTPLLAQLRRATAIVPWFVVTAYFTVTARHAPFLGTPDAFPDAERIALTRFWLWTAAGTVMAWVALRSVERDSTRNAVLFAVSVCALWVGVLGAAAWGRGAPVLWFVLPYVWSLAAGSCCVRQ